MSPRVDTALRFAGMALLVGFFVVHLDPTGLRALATPTGAAWIGAAVLAHVVGQVLNGLAWRGLLNRAGGAVGVWESVLHDLVSVFWSTVLPGGVVGEVVKGVRLARETDAGAVAVSIVVARLLGGGASCALAFAALPWSTLPAPVLAVAAASCGAGVAAAGLGLVALRVGPDAAMAGFGRLAGGWGPWLASRLPVGRFPATRDLAHAGALSLVSHIAFAWMFDVCFRAVGAPISLADAAVVSTLTSVAQQLPISVGGLGVRELTIAGLGATLVSAAGADAATVALSGVMTLFVLAGGLVELVWAAQRRRAAPYPPNVT